MRVVEAVTQTIVTSAEMCDAEAAAIAAGTSADTLMQRAGHAAAAAIAAFDGPLETLVLCGPGNNGGEGYVIAAALAAQGWPVRVAALAPPATEAAKAAAARWSGPVEALDTAAAPILVDALLGIGLTRPLDAALSETLHRLGDAARLRVAIDLPSGVSTDDGALLSAPLDCDLTITFCALKPAHVLYPAAAHMGRVVVADIGTDHASKLTTIGEPPLPSLSPAAHKFDRGHVAVISGPLASTGAARMAASGAARFAGYVTLLSPGGALAANAAHLTSTVLKRADTPEDVTAALAKVGAVVVGPGLGDGHDKVLAVLAAETPAVLDADVFTLFADDPETLFAAIRAPAVLTPHDGEFARLFGPLPGSKIDRARAAATRAGAVVVLKGADTVVAAPDGRAAVGRDAPAWLATAGSGDVLAGVIAALLARGLPAFEAACGGVWLHTRAGRRAGPGITGETLASDLP